MGLISAGLSYLVFSAIHIVQFALAITVCALYGIDLSRANKAGVDADSKWVYAEVVGALSAVTALLYLVPFILRFWLVWAWNLVLFILWIALFGVFGKMYINEDAEGDSGVQRMKNAVWVDLANAILWFLTFVGGAAYWFTHHAEERNHNIEASPFRTPPPGEAESWDNAARRRKEPPNWRGRCGCLV